jgi:hypothetical protein
VRRAELFEEIISREHLLDAVPERRGLRGARPSRHWRFRVQGARRLAIVWTLAAVTAAVVAVAVIAGSADRSPTTATVVSFRNAGDNEITATVTDPFAAESRLKAAFAQQHLNITVTLVPVSPSLVGTVIYTGGYGGAMSEIQALHGGHCVTGGGRCPIGVKSPPRSPARDTSGSDAPLSQERPISRRPAPSRPENCCTAAICSAHASATRSRCSKPTSSPSNGAEPERRLGPPKQTPHCRVPTTSGMPQWPRRASCSSSPLRSRGHPT